MTSVKIYRTVNLNYMQMTLSYMHMLEILVQYDIIRLVSWCDNNQLSVNIDKTKSVVFGTKKFTNSRNLPRI